VTSYDDYGYTKKNERAWPGYYAVDLVEPGVRVETTTAVRGAAFRFFAGKDGLNVLLDVTRPLSWVGGGHVEVTSPAEARGWVDTGLFCARSNHQRVYFAARLDRAAAASGTWAGGATSSADSADGDGGAWFHFDAAGGRTVELRVGVSYVGVDGARANLDAELAGRGFDQLRTAAQGAWEEALGRIRV